MTNTTQSNIFSQLHGFSPQKLPPLDKWHPTRITPFPLTIKACGDWIHENTKMTRQSLIKLFSSVLWAEQQEDTLVHFLKTPNDLYQITVEHTPLFVNRVDMIDGVLFFLTTTDDIIELNETHLPFFDIINDEQIPCILVRQRLLAKIERTAFYHLVAMGELIENNGQVALILNSKGQSYQIPFPNELEKVSE